MVRGDGPGVIVDVRYRVLLLQGGVVFGRFTYFVIRVGVWVVVSSFLLWCGDFWWVCACVFVCVCVCCGCVVGRVRAEFGFELVSHFLPYFVGYCGMWWFVVGVG